MGLPRQNLSQPSPSSLLRRFMPRGRENSETGVGIFSGLLRLLFVGIWMFTGASSSAQLIVNGGFDSDLSLWSSTGSVVHAGDVAVLTDSGVTQSLLYQPV